MRMTRLVHQSPVEADGRVVVVGVTWPADRDPLELAAPLVEERLAACVNVLPAMESVYRWEGAVQREPERQLLIKTTAERLEAVYARVRLLHPYDLPEFLVFEVAAVERDYRSWVVQSTRID